MSELIVEKRRKVCKPGAGGNSNEMNGNGNGNGKRSLSSTLLNFIKNPIRTSSGAYSGGVVRSKEGLGAVEGTKRLQKMDSIILYEQEDDNGVSRPPVLPLLPLQRLQLLRQKQLQRYNQVRLMGSAGGESADKNVLRLKSKQPVHKKQKLDKKKGVWSVDFEYDTSEVPVVAKISDNKPLSVVKLQSTPVINLASTKDNDQLSSTEKSLLSNGLLPVKTASVLSGIKIKVPLESNNVAKTALLPTAGFDFIKSDEEAKQSSIQLGLSNENNKDTNQEKKQSIGFSLGTASEPISKTEGTKPSFSFGLSKIGTSNQTDEKTVKFKTKPSTLLFNPEKSLANNTESSSSLESKPSFSFGKYSSGKTEEPPVKQQFSLSSSTTSDEPLTKKPFTFEQTSTSASDKKPDKKPFSFGDKPLVVNEEPQTKKPFTFGKSTNEVTNDSTKPNSLLGLDQTKPSFTFDTQPVEKKEANIASSFVFGGKTEGKPSATEKPTFSFGIKKEDKEDTSTATPSFIFGESKSIEKDAPSNVSVSEPNKPSFSLNLGSQLPKSGVKPAIASSFSFGKSNSTPTPTPTPTVTPTELSTDIKTNPFTFNTSTGPANPVINPLLTNPSVPGTNPLLSVGTNSAINNDKTPSFSFTKKRSQPSMDPTNANLVGGNPVTKPSFSFGNNKAAGITMGQSLGPSSFSGGMNTINPMNNTLNNVNNGPSMFGMNNNIPNQPQQPQQLVFNPSNSINLNFGNTSNVSPANIFGAQSVPPSQMFTGSASQVNQNPMGGGANPGQPMQRRLARMRAPRR